MPYSFHRLKIAERQFKFIDFTGVTSDTKGVISTPNIFVHEWGTYPTMIGPTVSNYTPLVRKGSVKGAITSVCALSGSKSKELLLRVISLEFVKICVMTLLLIILFPPLIIIWEMLPPLIVRGPLFPMITTQVRTGSILVGPSCK